MVPVEKMTCLFFDKSFFLCLFLLEQKSFTFKSRRFGKTTLGQGCQMVYFQTWVNFLEGLAMEDVVGLFYGHLVYLWTLDIFFGHSVYVMAIWYF
jgi:hypothetical protein